MPLIISHYDASVYLLRPPPLPLRPSCPPSLPSSQLFSSPFPSIPFKFFFFSLSRSLLHGPILEDGKLFVSFVPLSFFLLYLFLLFFFLLLLFLSAVVDSHTRSTSLSLCCLDFIYLFIFTSFFLLNYFLYDSSSPKKETMT